MTSLLFQLSAKLVFTIIFSIITRIRTIESQNMLNRYLFLAVVVLLSSCAKSFNEEDDLKKYRGIPAHSLYQQAHVDLSKSDYDAAIKKLEAFDSMYPFSEYARAADIDLIYAYYQNGDYAEAVATSDHFIHLRPRDKNIDYVYYLKAMANFAQKRGAFSKIFKLDESWRDPGTQRQSYEDFKIITTRFKNSPYYQDSLQHLIYLRNQFAKRELNIAKLYYNANRYVAALNRAQYVVTEYQQSPEAKEALKMLAMINNKLYRSQAHQEAKRVFNDTYKKA